MLKLTPYTVLPGQEYTASWGGAGGTFGTNFTDQGLQFTAGAGVGSATIASPGFGIAADAVDKLDIHENPRRSAM